ncbi:MAG: SDR family NAD(P)-dependent oxidoreductase, partial [Ectothiorhodospiraceae bacterium]
MSDQQRVALVTGASRGIGHAIAQRLAAQGHQVVGTATSDSGAQSLSEELAPVGGFGLRLDISDTDSISAAIDTIESRLGAPLILVNNAGITRDNLMMRMKDAEWDEAIDTNLTGLYRVTKRCLRGMMK